MPSMDIDPYRPSEGLFECMECDHRERATTHPGACSECGGPVRNIAVSRE